jgi:large subunit ribosomal protein L20
MRVTNAVARKARHKKVLKAARGFVGRRSKCYVKAKETLRRARRFAFVHRRKRKGEFRRLWITRISAAVRASGMSYSQFMHGLKKGGVEIDRKQLSNLAIEDPAAFERLIVLAREAVAA